MVCAGACIKALCVFGEESAGASFLTFQTVGAPTKTALFCVFAAEMLATTGLKPSQYYARQRASSVRLL